MPDVLSDEDVGLLLTDQDVGLGEEPAEAPSPFPEGRIVPRDTYRLSPTESEKLARAGQWVEQKEQERLAPTPIPERDTFVLSPGERAKLGDVQSRLQLLERIRRGE